MVKEKCTFKYKGSLTDCPNKVHQEDLCRQHHYYKVRGWGKNKR